MAFVDDRGRRTAPTARQIRRTPKKPPAGLRVPDKPLVLAPKPVGVFKRTAPRASDLGRGEAKRRVERAQQRLPQRPLPQVPVLTRPTKKQDSAKLELFARSTQGENLGDLWQDPRNRPALERLRAARERQNRRAVTSAVQAQIAGGATPERAAQFIADRASRHLAARPKPVRRIGIGPASINIAPAALAVSRFVAQHTTLDAGDAPSRLVKNFLGDAVALGSAPVVGGLAVGNAAFEAAHGRTGAAKDLGTGIVQGLAHDPLVLAAQGRFGEAGQSFSEHPGFGLLDAAAAVGAAGRVGAAVARGAGSTAVEGGVRGALARAGQGVRSPLALSEDAGAIRGGLVQNREGSRSLAGKGVQSVRDALRPRATDAEGNVITADVGGRHLPVLATSARQRERLLKKDADFDASRANSVERLARDEAGREMRARGIRGQARDLVSMVVEGTITSAKHFESDLKTERDRIAGQLKENDDRVRAGDEPVYRHKGELKAAQARLDTIEKALASPRALSKAEQLVKVGEDIGRTLNAREAEAERLGILHGPRARRARLVVPAIAHSGARHYSAEELQKVYDEQVAPARAAARAAKETHLTAQRDLSKAQDGLKRAQAAVRVRRGQRRAELVPPGSRTGATRAQRVTAYVDAAERHPRARQLAAAEQRDRKLIAKRQQKVAAAKRAVRAAEQRRKAAQDAARAMPKGLTPKALEHGALRHADGRFLSNREVEDVLRARGRDPETVAYLPHRLDVRGRRAFHTQFRPGSRSTLEKPGTRTGSAYRKGVTEASMDLVREQNARLATQVAKAQQIDRLVTDKGLRHPDGRYLTPREARELADRIKEDTGEKWTPVSAFPAKANRKMIARALEQQDPKVMESLHLKLLNRRVKAAEKGEAQNVVLMPAATIDRLKEHLAPAGGPERFLQMVNRAFRYAVLPQPRWLTGNFVEPFLIRLPVAGSGLVNIPGMALDIAASRKILRRLERSADPKDRAAAKELQSQQFGGLFVGGRGATNRRTAEEVPGGWIRDLPVVKQLTDLTQLLLGKPLNGYFRVNRAIESTAQHAALGRMARHEMQAFTGSWWKTVRLGKQAVDEAARGLRNTPMQARFMRAQHEMLGKYEGFSPTMRRLIQGPMPFLPWSLAAARFVAITMPFKHPVVTALLIKSQQAVQPEWDEAHKDAPPGGLRAALRTKDGGYVDVARYTPWGFSQPIAEGDLKNVTSPLLPQIASVLNALQGEDPFGRPLKVKPTAANPKGEASGGDKWGAAGNSLIEALVPWVSTIRRLREGGGTAYSDSTVFSPKTKPGTDRMSGPRRVFDPFRPTYLGGATGATAAAAGEGGMDEFDRQELRDLVSSGAVGLDQSDLDELRDLVRAGR